MGLCVIPPIARIRSNRRRSRAGITLIEVMISLFLFAMMTLMFSAVVPSSLRSSRYSNTYGHAMTIANRKMDQIIEAGFSRLDTTNLRTLGIIDNTAPTVSGNATTYYFTNNATAANANNPDNLATYFPNGVTGTIRVEPWSAGTWSGQSMLWQVTITITWRDAASVTQSYMLSSLITRMSVS